MLHCDPGYRQVRATRAPPCGCRRILCISRVTYLPGNHPAHHSYLSLGKYSVLFAAATGLLTTVITDAVLKCTPLGGAECCDPIRGLMSSEASDLVPLVRVKAREKHAFGSRSQVLGLHAYRYRFSWRQRCMFGYAALPERPRPAVSCGRASK